MLADLLVDVLVMFIVQSNFPARDKKTESSHIKTTWPLRIALTESKVWI